MNKQVIQLSGAITGVEKLAKKEFAAASASLRAAGYEVINPFELCEDLAPKREEMGEHGYWYVCVTRCTDMLMSGKVDVFAVINDITGSPGAKVEYSVALKANIPIVIADKGMRFGPESRMKELNVIADIIQGGCA